MTESNKLRRYIWCKTYENTNFDDYLFVDETTVRILDVPLYQSRKRCGRPQAQSCTSKYRLKVNIWGGISHKGPTPFVVRKK